MLYVKMEMRDLVVHVNSAGIIIPYNSRLPWSRNVKLCSWVRLVHSEIVCLLQDLF